jgi:signal transduction histidine kinase
MITGAPVGLLDFTALSNFAFVVNFVIVIFYSFGYWGFVLEKNQATLAAALAESRAARESEASALQREQAIERLLRERDALIAQITVMHRAAQAAALTASIAHEINQPLAAIRLDLEEVQANGIGRAGQELDDVGHAGAPDDPSVRQERTRNLIARALNETLRAAGIVRTLRDVFRCREAAPETRILTDVVASVADLLKRRAAELGVALTFDVDVPVRVRAGAGELEHVVLNLVTNALDAARHCPHGQQPTAHVQGRVDGNAARLIVRDNGPGVPLQDQPRLFELLHTSKEDGMGLGLWLSRHIIHRHGGQLVLCESHGPGACFMVELPLAK